MLTSCGARPAESPATAANPSRKREPAVFMIVQPSEQALARAAGIIRKGGLVAFPTETVYGLGANALDAEAVKHIYEAKGRPFASPLIVHVTDEQMARSLAADWPEIARRLAARFW